MDLLNQLVEDVGNVVDLDDVKFLNIIASNNYVILDNDGNKLENYIVTIQGNKKIYLDITNTSVILNNEVEIIPSDEYMYYSLIDDILSFLEIVEGIEPPKFSSFETLKNEVENFINVIKNNQNIQ